MAAPLRVDLLDALCALLPERDADQIRKMPVDQTLTYVEAYAAARRCGVDLPRDLRREFVNALLENIEEDFGSEPQTSDS
jgi:hypothetical protein